jgi:putative flavoprotein involved in K+ transport
MTEIAAPSAAAEVRQWLGRFEEALAAGDGAAASELFLEDSFWRDLVAFTWNMKTVEGPAQVREMLDHALGHVRPRGIDTPVYGLQEVHHLS